MLAILYSQFYLICVSGNTTYYCLFVNAENKRITDRADVRFTSPYHLAMGDGGPVLKLISSWYVYVINYVFKKIQKVTL